MPEYPCPECGSRLRSAKPLSGKKKIKCPKCEAVFLPEVDEDEPEEEEEAPPPKPAKPEKIVKVQASGDDEVYKFRDEDEEDEKSKKLREEALAPVKDRLPKSARGPALATCQAPTNQMLATSSFTCFSCVVSLLTTIWPMVFREEPMPSADKATAWLTVILAVACFAYSGVICVGAVKMQNVESYSFAMIASIMTLLPANVALCYWGYAWVRQLLGTMGDLTMFITMFFFVLGCWTTFTGLINILTLRKPKVMEGFKEKPAKTSISL